MRRRPKGREEGVSLRAHLDTVVFGDRLPHNDGVAILRTQVSVSQLLEEPRGPLDVGEEERDGARRELCATHLAVFKAIGRPMATGAIGEAPARGPRFGRSASPTSVERHGVPLLPTSRYRGALWRLAARVKVGSREVRDDTVRATPMLVTLLT